MGDFQFIDIVFFAMVALFLILRLRSVLGKRTGTERHHPDRFPAPPTPAPSRPESDKVVALPDRGADQAASAPAPALGGLDEIRAADARFNEQEFLSGARAAFEMIIGAFAAGDRKALRSLLSDEVYDNFAREIDRRERAGEKLDNAIVRMVSVDIIEARLEGRNALVTVKFVSEQTNVLRNSAGEPLPGQSASPSDVIDVWTFARNTRASDPNWTLVATGTTH